MPSDATLLAFAFAALALLVVPGPSVIYVVARSIEHGRTAGLLSMLGLETGALLHAAAAAVGVTALVASWPAAFSILKFAGALYLIMLGVAQFKRQPAMLTSSGQGVPMPSSRLFRHGVLVDLLNPKTGMFFLAFLPQFVEPQRGPVPIQIGVLGGCFVVLAAVIDSSYAVLAASLRDRLARSAANWRRVNRVTAGVYVGLGGLTALA